MINLHLVCRGLPWPGDVPGDLGPDAVLALGGVVQHVLHRLLLAPVQGVQPSVHNQATRSENFLAVGYVFSRDSDLTTTVVRPYVRAYVRPSSKPPNHQ